MADPAVYLPEMARFGMPGPMLRFCYEMLQRGDRMDDL